MKPKKNTIKRVLMNSKSTYIDPSQLGQYSAKHQVSESALDDYLQSRGIDPSRLSTQTKISHAKSMAFLKWKRDHVKEEVVSEVSSDLLSRYKEKAKKSADDLYAKGQYKKSTDRFMNVAKATGKQIDKLSKEDVEVVKRDVQPVLNALHKKSDSIRKKGLADFRKKHAPGELLPTKEDVGDAKAATNADGLPNVQLEPVSEKKKQMSRSARIIKALYKKKGVVKEDMYDHEKEDKSVATYGKKPKHEKAEKDEGGEKKPRAAATLTGGTTLTGAKRDDVEIDPMMRNRPGQPDVTKRDDKDKKKDGKKEEKK